MDAKLLKDDKRPGVRQAEPPWRRWLALALFCSLAILQNMCFVGYSAVLAPSARYYNVSQSKINFLSTLASIVFVPCVFVLMPMANRHGLRAPMLLSSALLAAAGALRIAFPASYSALLVAQTLNGAAGPLVMNVPPLLSATWFPAAQRTLATAIGFSAMTVGVAAVFLLAPAMVHAAADVARLNNLHAALSALQLLAVAAAFPVRPAAPPSASAGAARVQFFAGLQALWRAPPPSQGDHATEPTAERARSAGRRAAAERRAFWWLVLVASASNGVYGAWSNLFDSLLSDRFSEARIGWLAFANNVSGLFGSVIFGALVDRGATSLKGGLVGALALTTLAQLAFFAAHDAGGYGLLLATCAASGFFFNAAAPMQLELAAELTFPVGEETSAAVISLGYALSNIVGMFVGDAVTPRTFNIALAAFLALCAAAIGVLVVNGDARQRIDHMG